MLYVGHPTNQLLQNQFSDGFYVKILQKPFKTISMSHICRVDTLQNKPDGTTKEKNPFKYDFDKNYDTKHKHKHVAEDFEKDI